MVAIVESQPATIAIDSMELPYLILLKELTAHLCILQIPALKQRVRRFWQQRNESGNLGLGPGEDEDEEQSTGVSMRFNACCMPLRNRI